MRSRIAKRAQKFQVAANGVKSVKTEVESIHNPRTIFVPNFSAREPPWTCRRTYPMKKALFKSPCWLWVQQKRVCPSKSSKLLTNEILMVRFYVFTSQILTNTEERSKISSINPHLNVSEWLSHELESVVVLSSVSTSVIVTMAMLKLTRNM